MNHQVAIIALSVGVLVVLGYILVMRVFFRESEELDKHIDLTKMKKWKDEED